MRKIVLVFILALVMLSVSFSEIIIGDSAVSHIANIYFKVADEKKIAVEKQIVSIGLLFIILAMLLRTVEVDITSKKGILVLLAIITSIAMLVSTFSIL